MQSQLVAFTAYSYVLLCIVLINTILQYKTMSRNTKKLQQIFHSDNVPNRIDRTLAY